MKLLVAEDEPKTGTYLQQGLSEAGFTVDRVTSGTDALQHVLSVPYDLLILDVMMPGLDGWEVLRLVRASGNEVPVLFLTARSSIADRVQGLELGADDYLAKPFAFAELLARVRAAGAMAFTVMPSRPSFLASDSASSSSLSVWRSLQTRPPRRTPPLLAYFRMPLEMLLAAYMAIISPEQTM